LHLLLLLLLLKTEKVLLLMVVVVLLLLLLLLPAGLLARRPLPLTATTRGGRGCRCRAALLLHQLLGIPCQ
jgi:hypothetical protein